MTRRLFASLMMPGSPARIARTLLLLLMLAPSQPRADSNGRWKLLTAPSRRGAHETVLDPVTDRLIIFGGTGEDGYSDDLWSLSLTGGSPWAAIVPVATPGKRVAASMILDPIRRRLVLFGGTVGRGPGSNPVVSNDLWTFSLDGPPVWTRLVASGGPPSPRTIHEAIYDPVRDRMIVFGGDSGGQNPLADMWALSLAGTPTWTPLPSCPYASIGPRAIFDPGRDRLVFLMDPPYQGLNPVWAFSFGSGTWAELPAGPTPMTPGRRLPAVTYDPDGDRLFVYGGFDGSSFVVRSDLWAYDFGTPGWTQLAPMGSAPGARYRLDGVYDAARRRMVMAMGGSDRQAWALLLAPLGAWSAVTPPDPVEPSARFRHDAVYDAPRQRMVIYGAGNPWTPGDELWSLALAGAPAFSPLAATNSPGVLFRPIACLDPDPARLILFDGEAGGGIWRLDLASMVWTHVVPALPPDHAWVSAWTAGTYDPARDRLVVFGGSTEVCQPPIPGCSWIHHRETWALDLSGAPTWTKLVVQGEPPPQLEDAVSVYDPVRDRIVVHGGIPLTPGTPGRTYALSLSGTPTWSVLAEPPSPELAGSGETMVYDPLRDRMVVYGGVSHPYADQAWALSLSGTPTWQELTSADPPYDIPYEHAAIYDAENDRMIVHHGYNGNVLRTTWALEWSDAPTAIRISSESAVATASGVQLSWRVSSPGANATVERSEGDGAWAPTATVAADGSGRVSWTDSRVVSGRRYGYRLSLAGTESSVGGEVWVEIPGAAALAVRVRNPSAGMLVVEVLLPAQGPARLELLDVAGRRLAVRDVGRLGPGRHEVALALPASTGLVVVRLTSAGATATAKTVRLR